MRKCLLASLILSSLSCGGLAELHQIEDYTWKNRVIVLSHPKNSKLGAQQSEVLSKDPNGLEERDLLVLNIEDISNAEGLKLNPSEFTILLLGKDGGIKLRQNRVVSLEELYNLIDAMPMRRREMKELRPRESRPQQQKSGFEVHNV